MPPEYVSYSNPYLSRRFNAFGDLAFGDLGAETLCAEIAR
jgi:hypothetical protein